MSHDQVKSCKCEVWTSQVIELRSQSAQVMTYLQIMEEKTVNKKYKQNNTWIVYTISHLITVELAKALQAILSSPWSMVPLRSICLWKWVSNRQAYRIYLTRLKGSWQFHELGKKLWPLLKTITGYRNNYKPLSPWPGIWSWEAQSFHGDLWHVTILTIKAN